MKEATPATPSAAASDGTPQPTWKSTPKGRAKITTPGSGLWDLLTANAAYLDEAETEEPLLAAATEDKAAAAYAANVYGSATAAFISAAVNRRQLDRRLPYGPPTSVRHPARPADAASNIALAVTDDRAPDLMTVYEAAAGLVWNHLGWVPEHDWVPIVGPNPRDHHGSPAWQATNKRARFADDLVIGPASDHYPHRARSMLLYWSHILGDAFQGIRVISALAPETNLWVYPNGVTVRTAQAPPFTQRIQDVPRATNPSAEQDAQLNPWRPALEALHQHEERYPFDETDL